MKEFFEEYGRTTVTVLIILGIILVGYTIAGNGRQSAFGRFTTDVVDSLSGQASSILKDSAVFVEKSAKLTPIQVKGDRRGETKATVTEKDGVQNIALTGKSDGWTGYGTNHYSTYTDAGMTTPWGAKSVMSFDITADKDFDISLDFNAIISGAKGYNDYYTHNTRVSVNGSEKTYHDSQGDISLKGNRWHHVIVILENGNEDDNPKHLPMTACNTIHYQQDGGTTNYQLKNVRYGNVD